jgi:hypothetical protein
MGELEPHDAGFGRGVDRTRPVPGFDLAGRFSAACHAPVDQYPPINTHRSVPIDQHPSINSECW